MCQKQKHPVMASLKEFALLLMTEEDELDDSEVFEDDDSTVMAVRCNMFYLLKLILTFILYRTLHVGCKQ